MPRYEYQCDQCDHRFELKQSFSSEPVATCPICQGGAHRRIHAVPVVFKGNGWYVTDYGKGASGVSSDGNGAASVEKSPAQTEVKSADTKAEVAKPEGAKAETSKAVEAKAGS